MSADLQRPLLEALKSDVLVIDGAMGTQLYERGILYSACFEELNVSRPEVVSRVHEDYVRAGATLIEPVVVQVCVPASLCLALLVPSITRAAM